MPRISSTPPIIIMRVRAPSTGPDGGPSSGPNFFASSWSCRVTSAWLPSSTAPLSGWSFFVLPSWTIPLRTTREAPQVPACAPIFRECRTNARSARPRRCSSRLMPSTKKPPTASAPPVMWKMAIQELALENSAPKLVSSRCPSRIV